MQKKYEVQYLKGLIDENNYFEALLGLFQFATEANSIEDYCNPKAKAESKTLFNEVFTICNSNYSETRQRLLKTIKKTKDRDALDAALFLLFHYGDYNALAATRHISIQFPATKFYDGFPDYVGRLLTLTQPLNTAKLVAEYKIHNTRFNGQLINSKISFFRKIEDNLAPVLNDGKHIDLGTGIFAVSFDPITDCILLSDKVNDKVIGVDKGTPQPIRELKCPGPGARGMAIHTSLRRGFVNCEFTNSMY